MNKMNKIALLLCGALLCVQSTSLAEIQHSQVGNVVSISSSYSYKDPAQMQEYMQKKAQQQAQKDSSDEKQEKLTEPQALFQIYLNNDKFYKDKDASKYDERLDISFTSHNMERNYIFDRECPPYLVVDNGSSENVLKFKQFKFDNPYWISFALTENECSTLLEAKKITVIIPEAQSSLYKYNKKKERMEKRDYDENTSVHELRYDVPDDIIAEWKQVIKGSL